MSLGLKTFEVHLLGADSQGDIRIFVEARWWPEAKEIAEKQNPGCKAVSAEEIGSQAAGVLTKSQRVFRTVWRTLVDTVLAIIVAVLIVGIFIAIWHWNLNRPRTEVSERDYAIIGAMFQSELPQSLDIQRLSVVDRGTWPNGPSAFYQATVEAAEFELLLQNVHAEASEMDFHPPFLEKLGGQDKTLENLKMMEEPAKKFAGAMPSFHLWRRHNAKERAYLDDLIRDQEAQNHPHNYLNDLRKQRDSDKAVLLGSVFVDTHSSPSLTLYLETRSAFSEIAKDGAP